MFDPLTYGPDVGRILKGPGAQAALRAASARYLFPASRSPEGALAGLWLYHGAIDEAHAVVQSLNTGEGSFWHGIVHRREPDAANAGYWFRRVGHHPVFPAIRAAVMELLPSHPGVGFPLGPAWDPHAWIEFWDRFHTRSGSPQYDLALEIQRVEWEILFDYCARPVS